MRMNGIGLRQGLSLVELLVVIGIVFAVLGLLLPAIVKVRVAATRLENMNKIRQILTATHNYSDANGGYLPNVAGFNFHTTTVEYSLYVGILPYLEGSTAYERYRERYPTKGSGGTDVVLPIFINRVDPSLVSEPKGQCSFAANAQVFKRRKTWNSVRDGLGNTIAFSEHYSRCGISWFSWFAEDDPFVSLRVKPIIFRAASFADPKADDVLPVRKNGATHPSDPGLTFQTSPSLSACNARIPQSPDWVLLAGMCDGSVQVLHRNTSPSVFWSAVTPATGDFFNPEW